MTTTLDFVGRYRVAGYPGVAFYLHGYPQRWEPVTYLAIDEDGEEYEETDYLEGEFVEDSESGMVVAVMVGDDREHLVDVSELTLLEDGEYCGGCGQIGCGHGGWS